MCSSDLGVNIDESKEADYGDEYQDMVKRVGQKAKEGERKVAYNPVTRKYKTVPATPPKEQDVNEVSDETLLSYLTKVDADSRKHKSDPTKRSPEKANKSVSGFSRAFNKLDARKGVSEEVSSDFFNKPEDAPYMPPTKNVRMGEDRKSTRLNSSH